MIAASRNCGRFGLLLRFRGFANVYTRYSYDRVEILGVVDLADFKYCGEKANVVVQDGGSMEAVYMKH
jgi:hypothetical protein